MMNFIIRGLPGSGKSTLAELISDYYGIPVFEADQWHYLNGDYNFSFTELPNAHKYCTLAVEQCAKAGINCIVSNTNLIIGHVAQYMSLFNQYNMPYKIIRCIGEFQNIHNVPNETVERMRNKMDIITNEILYLPDSFSELLKQLPQKNKIL